jgi:hypothetical protein
MCGAVVS